MEQKANKRDGQGKRMWKEIHVHEGKDAHKIKCVIHLIREENSELEGLCYCT